MIYEGCNRLLNEHVLVKQLHMQDEQMVKDAERKFQTSAVLLLSSIMQLLIQHPLSFLTLFYT